jgi:2-polyprenyl-3-methyl-5-hydroxy-6-metoxy-1,4-benzoquinol methylase
MRNDMTPLAEVESDRVANLAGWYTSQQLDFDRRLTWYNYQTFKPLLHGTVGLELGPAEGVMTQHLVNDFRRLTVVEGAQELLDAIPPAPNLIKVCSLFEDFRPDSLFDTVVMSHILEHVKDPVGLLRQGKSWLARGGRLIASVPNGHSLHRLAAAKMGLLAHPCELNERDHALGHRRVYTPATFRDAFDGAGVRVIGSGGVFLKPVTNKQIEDTWTERMMDGFFELGKDFPQNSAELYLIGEMDG